MAKGLKVACVQMTSGPDISGNLKKAEALIREAAAQGARFIATPENTCHMRKEQKLKLENCPTEADHPAIPFFASLAKELGITLLIGSLSIKDEALDKMHNRSYLVDEQGGVCATYDKIHLFEVNLPSGEVHREADIFEAGTKAVTAPINEDFKAGLTICYDLRFPHLFRDLTKAGANILCVPAAFTVPTGKAHWEELLRVRAIENGAFVMAPAQVGEHEGGRKTYGHSLIIAPWGEVLAHLDEGEGICMAELDFDAITKARSRLYALDNDRGYQKP